MQRQEVQPRTDYERVGLAYEDWMRGEGILVHEQSAGIDDVTELPRAPWARMGGSGTFIQLDGPRQAERGIYVVEIPGGGALNPERHLYDEVLYILQGRGVTEVWYEGESKRTFEWGTGSVFALPINTWHRLVNGGREPVLVLAFTRAPRLMKLFNNTDFIFNNDYEFRDRYAGEAGYFNVSDNRVTSGRFQTTTWFTNFIPDVAAAFLDDLEQKVAGGQLTSFSMGTGFPHGHISEWPVGRYHKAHYHGPGAIIVGLSGKGYVVLWPKELGVHPFQDGHGDQVSLVNWGPRSIYAPPDGWFHQHQSTGKVPARHWAIHGEPLSFSSVSESRRRPDPGGGERGVYVSVREGGELIEYEDEDPEIRRYFEERVGEEGVECTMPAVVYRTDPLPARVKV